MVEHIINQSDKVLEIKQLKEEIERMNKTNESVSQCNVIDMRELREKHERLKKDSENFHHILYLMRGDDDFTRLMIEEKIIDNSKGDYDHLFEDDKAEQVEEHNENITLTRIDDIEEMVVRNTDKLQENKTESEKDFQFLLTRIESLEKNQNDIETKIEKNQSDINSLELEVINS